MGNLLRGVILLLLFYSLAACSAEPVHLGSKKAENITALSYMTVLGRPVADQMVTDFIASNHCSEAAQVQICNDAGMALWIDSSRRVQTVYLYLDNAEGFVPYKGELPLGLKYYDIMEAVEYKLKRQGVGNAGLPDEGGSPDHLHYWATYKQVGMTIIYNSPSPEDEDATIYAILVSQ